MVDGSSRLTRLLKAELFRVVTEEPSKAVITRLTNEIDMKARAVCKRCNGGWMSKLESTFGPIAAATRERSRMSPATDPNSMRRGEAWRPARRGVGALRRSCSPTGFPVCYSRLLEHRPQTGALSALS